MEKILSAIIILVGLLIALFFYALLLFGKEETLTGPDGYKKSKWRKNDRDILK